MVVAVLAVTIAGSPLKSTRLSIGLVLKFVPVIITTAPIVPVVGEKEVMVGAGKQTTLKSVELVTVLHAIVILIGTVSKGPVGTVVVMLVAVLEVTMAV
jgi:hypothetical protein